MALRNKKDQHEDTFQVSYMANNERDIASMSPEEMTEEIKRLIRIIRALRTVGKPLELISENDHV